MRLTLQDMHNQVMAKERILQDKDRNIAALRKEVERLQEIHCDLLMLLYALRRHCKNLELCIKWLKKPWNERIFRFKKTSHYEGN